MGILDAPAPTQERLRAQNDAALRRFRAAFADRARNPVMIATWGDSKTEGQTSDVGATAADSWPRQLLTSLRAKYQPAGVVGGEGFIPAKYGYSVPSAQGFTLAGNWTDYQDSGPGLRSVLLNDATATATITRTMTSFDLHYRNFTNGTKITVAIDGGAATTITTAAPSGARRQSFTGLTAGSHTVVIGYGAGSAAPVRFIGIDVFNGDETKGIRLVDASHAGWTTSQFNAGLTNWTGSLNLFAPDLVLCRLGRNDFTNNSSATFKSQLLNMVSGSASSLNTVLTKQPSYVLMMPEDITQTKIEPYANYRQALYDIAATDPTKYTVFDLGLRMSPDATSDPLGLIGADGIHETRKGYAFVADAVERFLFAA